MTRDHLKREYNRAMALVGKYHMLQSMRRTEGYFGASLFYQEQAKRWHIKAMEFRLEWEIADIGSKITPYTGPRGPAVEIIVISIPINHRKFAAAIAFSGL